MRRLHFIAAIENRFIAKLYVFDQKEDEDSIETFIALPKTIEPSSQFFCCCTTKFLGIPTKYIEVSTVLRLINY